MKDLFSDGAEAYSTFRPEYPESLIQFLLARVAEHNVAWDCGTGSGQLAAMLAPHFGAVHATDISDQQLQQAPAIKNVFYKKEPAEHTAFPAGSFDLITVAQAIHWFQFDAFYDEVYRTLKDNGLFAVTGYALLSIHPAIDEVIQGLYSTILGPYWDAERRYIDEWYLTIPFPFEEIETPQFTQQVDWTIDQLFGYLRTWSAVHHYRRSTGQDPLLLVKAELEKAWGSNTTCSVTIPILLRAGRKRPQQ